MIKMTQLLLAGAAALALSDVGLAQDTPPKPPGGAFADYVSPSDLGGARHSPYGLALARRASRGRWQWQR